MLFRKFCRFDHSAEPHEKGKRVVIRPETEIPRERENLRQNWGSGHIPVKYLADSNGSLSIRKEALMSESVKEKRGSPGRFFATLYGPSAFFLTACLLFFRPGMLNAEASETVEKPHLVSVAYVSSGDMIGSYHEMKLAENGEGEKKKLVLTVIEAERHDTERIEKKYKKINPDALSDLEAYFNMTGCYRKWKSYRQSEFFALDAATDTISITFSDRSSYSISSTCERPKKEASLFSDVYLFLKAYSVKRKKAHLTMESAKESSATYTVKIEKPWMVEMDWKLHVPDSTEDAPFSIVYSFQGRIPGTSSITITEKERSGKKTRHRYKLTIDRDYQVVIEKK